MNPSKGLYIKLGESGRWEKECLEHGILRFGYRQTPFEAAASGDWEKVRTVWLDNAFVQVKSSASKQDLTQYIERLKDSHAYDRMFFVWHSGDVGEVEESNVALIGPGRLARMVFDAGLTSWLREKVS